MDRAALTAAEKRRLRNQQSARDSRKRQKEYTESLERKVAELQAEVVGLRARLGSGKAASGGGTPPPMTIEAELRAEEREMVGKIKDQLRARQEGRPTTDPLDTLVDNYVKQLLSFSARRKNLVLMLVEQLHRLIEPTAAEKFLIWGLQQPDSFFAEAGRYIHRRDREAAAAQRAAAVGSGEKEAEDAEEEGNVLCALARRLNMSPAQHTRIMNLREHAPAVLQGWRRMLGTISQLQEDMEAVAQPTRAITEQMKSSFTAEQCASFIVWIGTNKPIAQMLKSLWVPSPHILSELEARAAARAELGGGGAGAGAGPGLGASLGLMGLGLAPGAAAGAAAAFRSAAACAPTASTPLGVLHPGFALARAQSLMSGCGSGGPATLTPYGRPSVAAHAVTVVSPPSAAVSAALASGGGAAAAVHAPDSAAALPSACLAPFLDGGPGGRKRRRLEGGEMGELDGAAAASTAAGATAVDDDAFMAALGSPCMFDPRIEDALMDALQSSFLH